MVQNLKVEHGVIGRLLDDIAASNHEDALKKLAVLKLLLVNHFFAEEFVLFPYLREKYLVKPKANQRGLFDAYGVHDEDCKAVIALIKNINYYTSVGTRILSLLSSCHEATPEDFDGYFKTVFDFVKERMHFEDTVLSEKMLAKMTADRINIRLSVVLYLEGKETISGTTVNVNRTGCLFKLDPHTVELAVDDIGFLCVPPLEMGSYFQCQIARITEDGIAVRFLECV